MRFSEKELMMISLALRIAAERFDAHAAVCGKELARLGEQFKRQASEARDIYSRIDATEGIAN